MTGCVVIVIEFFLGLQQVDAKVVRDVCSKYIYDQCPALVGIGKQRVIYSQIIILHFNFNPNISNNAPLSQAHLPNGKVKLLFKWKVDGKEGRKGGSFESNIERGVFMESRVF